MITENDIGHFAQDEVTGFCGIITGYASYLTGCSQVLLTPRSDETNKYPEGVWLDVNRVHIQHTSVKIELDTSKDKGAMSAPPKF